MQLSLMMVTQGASRAERFVREFADLADALRAEFVLGLHGCDGNTEYLNGIANKVVNVDGKFLEEMLDPVIAACSGDNILRLDDDERCSDSMMSWLKAGAYLEHDSWFFPRYHLWPDREHVIVQSPFFPDFQQRLTSKVKARRPPTLHAGSPYPAYPAPVYMEHHNFLAKSYAERQALTATYETLRTGKLFKPEDVDVVCPEDWKNLRIVALSPALQQVALKHVYWRAANTEPPPALRAELDRWVKDNVQS